METMVVPRDKEDTLRQQSREGRVCRGEHCGLSLRSMKGHICFNIFVSQRCIWLSFFFGDLPHYVALAALELYID